MALLSALWVWPCVGYVFKCAGLGDKHGVVLVLSWVVSSTESIVLLFVVEVFNN